MEIEHISVSRHSTWQQCQQSYKYKYHLKMSPLGPEPFYFVYGKIIHKIAEEYVSLKGEKLLSEVANDVLQGKIPLERNGNVFAPDLPPDYRRRMPEHLKSIKTITDKMGTDGQLEYPFNYDLDPPNNKFIKGFIDRLINKGDMWFILDYKTTKKGKWRKDNQSITHDLQLRTYARVVQKHFNVPAENIRCALYYLEGGNLVAAKYSQASIEAAEAELLQAYNDIVSKDADKVKGNVGEHCNRCDWKTICPFFNLI